MSIVRVFPRRTSATPDDEMAFVGNPPLFLPTADEVHVSCAFTWDRPEAERLAKAWASHGYKVSVGGPAYDAPAGDFTPGMYVKAGMTITSRGCIRRCPFCFVPQREGKLRLLDIKPGWNILDNNLLACPRPHVEAVLYMLEEQRHPARFTGGIDARLCERWFALWVSRHLRLDILYTAYDSPDQKLAVERTICMFVDEHIRQRAIGCFVLVGYCGDTVTKAERRLEWVFSQGATPYAMYYRAADAAPRIPPEWKTIVRDWSRPAIVFAKHGLGEENT